MLRIVRLLKYINTNTSKEMKINDCLMYRAVGISWVKGSVCFVLKFALPPFSPPLPSGVQYRAEGIYWVKGSVRFV